MVGLLDLLADPEAMARIYEEKAKRDAVAEKIAACYGVTPADADGWLTAWEDGSIPGTEPPTREMMH